MVKLNVRKEKKRVDSFKEEMISSHDDRFTFKDSKHFRTIRDKVNDALKTHFDQKAFEKEQNEQSKKTTSRFDKTNLKKKKIIGLFLGISIKTRI